MEAAFDGTYIVELNVSDKAGNWACDQFTLIWDTTPPDIQVAVLGNRTGFWLNITDDNFLSAYCAYGGANASCAGTEFFDTSSLAPGWYNYSVWANDLANNSISDRITLCIESTPPPLAIVNTMPANGNVQVSIHENISIEFNQPMNVSSVINAIEITELPLDATLNYTWNVENTILTIEVIPGFSQNTLYTVSVGSGAESIYGITLAKDYIFSFTTWTDSDGDNIPDNIDEDDDNDGIADPYDAFPLDPSESLDTDDDGTGNNADPDDDNDGVPDTDDAFPLDPTEWLDTDNDGIGNNADPDDDNDGVPDTEDYEPLDPSVTKAQTFVGRYWWAITILAVVSVVGVAVYILRKRKLPQASEPENIEDSEDQQDTG